MAFLIFMNLILKYSAMPGQINLLNFSSIHYFGSLTFAIKLLVMFIIIKFPKVFSFPKISLLLSYNLDLVEVQCDFKDLNYFVFKEIFYSFFSLMKLLEKCLSLFLFFIFLLHFLCFLHFLYIILILELKYYFFEFSQ